ncbi:MAG: Gfo/Idh/MocA family oxidoreductase [Caldilineaceae bacterium]
MPMAQSMSWWPTTRWRSVATPSQLHVSDATKAMRGKHVIVEKPMAPHWPGSMR